MFHFQLNEAKETAEQRILAAAAPMEALRFSVLITSRTNLDAEKEGDESTKMRAGEKVWHTYYTVPNFFLRIPRLLYANTRFSFL